MVLLAALAVVVAGCRLSFVVDLEVDPEGAGQLGLVASLDPAAVAELDALGVDPTAELDAVLAQLPAWRLSRSVPDGGGLTVRLDRDLEDAGDAPAVLEDLVAGLTESDPALVVDLDLEVAEEGATDLSGTAMLRPPATAGAVRDGEPVGPAGDELAALVDDALDVAVVVTVPGTIRATDADRVEGATARWQVPVGQPRELTLRADPPSWLETWWPWLAAAAAGLAVLAAGVRATRSRRRRRGSPVLR